MALEIEAFLGPEKWHRAEPFKNVNVKSELILVIFFVLNPLPFFWCGRFKILLRSESNTESHFLKSSFRYTLTYLKKIELQSTLLQLQINCSETLCFMVPSLHGLPRKC